MKEIVAKKLHIKDKVNEVHSDHSDSVERKFLLLDAWRRRNELCNELYVNELFRIFDYV